MIQQLKNTHPKISFTHEYSSTAVSFLDVIIKINNGIISTSSYKKNTDNHRYLHYTSCNPMHKKNSMIFFTASQIQKNMFRQKGFYETQQRTSHTFFHIGYPNKFIFKQWDKLNKVHRASLFTQREKTTDNYIPLEQTYHPTIVSTNKSVIKEWKLYSNINSAKNFFCNSPVCANRQPPNLIRMLVKSNLCRLLTLVGSSRCMKQRCQICDILDRRKKLQFRQQVLPFYLETTIVILLTLSIYSCVTNVTLEIT